MSDGVRDTSSSVAPVVGAGALVLVAVLVAVFWPQPRTSLRQPSSGPGTSNSTVRIPNTKAGTGYRLVAVPVCVAHGPVTIQSVKPHTPVGSIHIVDWAVSSAATKPPNPKANLTVGRAREITGYANRSVTASCDRPQYLAIAVDRSSDLATARGFDVTSSSGTILTPATVTLCAKTCG